MSYINFKSIIQISQLPDCIAKSVLFLTKTLYVSINSSKEPAVCLWRQYRFQIELCIFISPTIKTRPLILDFQQMSSITHCNVEQNCSHGRLLLILLSYKLITWLFLNCFPNFRSHSLISKQRQKRLLIRSV